MSLGPTATIAIYAMWIILKTWSTIFTRTITCAFPCNFLDIAMDNTLFVGDVNIEETCCWKVSQYVRISDRLQTLYACACREACILEFLKRNGTLPSIYLTNSAEIEIDAAVGRPFSRLIFITNKRWIISRAPMTLAQQFAWAVSVILMNLNERLVDLCLPDDWPHS